MSASVIIVGAGGHGRVVADALQAAGVSVTGFIDNDPTLAGSRVQDLPVLGDDQSLFDGGWAQHPLVNGIGAMAARIAVQRILEARGRRFVGVRHPAAVVSRHAVVEGTAQILAGAIVQAGAMVEADCIINTRAVVEHDCRLGAFTHCAPGSVLCGQVTTGRNVHVGAGAVVRENIRLGDGVFVGAGAVVVADYLGAARLLGVPARPC